MAIAKKITFEGNKYYLGNKDRVSAFTAFQGGGPQFKGFRGVVLSGGGTTTLTAEDSGKV